MAETELVGILNLTPDSFSDGGQYVHEGDAVKAIEKMIEDGANVIDIGAESTRPGAVPVTPEEEWRRLAPVLAALVRFPAVEFSIDTRNAETAEKALEHGAHWINDVSGFANPAMVDAVKSSDCTLVVMHSLSVPANPKLVMPESVDVVQELIAFGHKRIEQLQKAGIPPGRIVFDPGIGFGKTAAQSLSILRGVEKFRVLGVPLLIGHSRKSFLSAFSSGSPDNATLGVSHSLAEQGVDYLRVHDVARHRQMLDSLGALHG